MTTYPTHPRNPSRAEAEDALSTLDFPLDKDGLVRAVESGRGADDAVVRQLRSPPLAIYDSADQVLQSIDTADRRGP